MVWENLRRKDAAEKAGLADAPLRLAFRKPHVMAYYHAELAALVTTSGPTTGTGSTSSRMTAKTTWPASEP